LTAPSQRGGHAMPTRHTLAGQFIDIHDLAWGDQGKGSVALKIIMFLQKLGIQIRYAWKPNGANNSYHGGRKDDGSSIGSQILPLSVFADGVNAVISPGALVPPADTVAEMQRLSEQGVDLSGTKIDGRCPVVLPVYKDVEQACEQLMGASNVGTTMKAIGQTYAFRAFRFGPRMYDLVDTRERAVQKVSLAYNLANAILSGCGLEEQSFDIDEILEPIQELEQYVTDTQDILKAMRKDGEIGIIEPGQGGLLGNIFGTYPGVTSSLTTVAGMLGQAGIPMDMVAVIVPIIKAYFTRVGNGPFPTEDKGMVGEQIRQRGGEYGGTTGRPRRCGPIDFNLVNYQRELNYPDPINNNENPTKVVSAITKLDVLDGMEQIQYCDSYGNPALHEPPADIETWSAIKANFKTIPGWDQTSGIRKHDQLPLEAQNYLHLIREKTKIPIGMITNGAMLSQMIIMEEMLKAFGIH